MLEMTVAEVINATQALQSFGAHQLPPKFAARLVRIRKACTPHIDTFNEVRQKTMLDTCRKDEAGTPIEENGSYQFDDEKALRDSIVALMGERVPVPAEPLKLSEIPETVGREPLLITPDILDGLGPLFIDDSERVP